MPGGREKAWLIDGPGGASGKRRPAKEAPKKKPAKAETKTGGDTAGSSPWLAVPRPGGKAGAPKTAIGKSANGKRANGKKAGGSAAQANGSKSQGRNPQRDKRRMVAKLRKAERDLSARDEKIAKLEARVAELEADASAPKPKAAPSAPKKKASSARPARRPSAGAKDLNKITFEELRLLGLTVTQSARLVAARDMRDGFDSVDELDKLAGFPKETIDELKQRFSKPR